ncbi:hypothetical protein ABZ543_34375 [Streptomyces roseifaciens]
MQITGEGPDAPYLAGITSAVRREFGDRVPMLVVPFVPMVRAREWMEQRSLAAHLPAAAPCSLACWPVIGFIGQAIACGNQDVMDGAMPMPPHLFLGHIARDDRETVRQQALGSPALEAEAIRTYGPEYLMEWFAGERACEGHCASCWKMGKPSGMREGVRDLVLLPSAVATRGAVEQMAADAGPVGLARCWGIDRYADLVTLGGPGERGLACAG